MRLRQVALVAEKLEPVVDDLCAILGLEVAFRDPAVGVFGLCNAVIPIGDTFLEVVSPTEADTAAGRHLARRGGDGGYMVILQCEDLDADRRRIEGLGVRVVWKADLPDIRGTHLHPSDVGGAILSLDDATPPASWRWAGESWRSHVSTRICRALTAAELQSADPEALGRRWSELLARPLIADADGFHIALEGGSLRFVEALDGRGPGLGGIRVTVTDRAALLGAARARGVPVGERGIEVGGMRVGFD